MGKQTQHICLVTGKMEPAFRLIRFCACDDNRLVPDLAAKLPGRALWVTGCEDIIRLAMVRDVFSHAVGKKLDIADDLPSQLDGLLEAQVASLLGLARRAGAIASGFTKTEAALHKRGTSKGGASKGAAELVLLACDRAGDGRRKITSLARRHKVVIINSLSVHQLSLALGRENVVYAVVTASGWAARIALAVARLTLYRKGAIVAA